MAAADAVRNPLFLREFLIRVGCIARKPWTAGRPAANVKGAKPIHVLDPVTRVASTQGRQTLQISPLSGEAVRQSIWEGARRKS